MSTRPGREDPKCGAGRTPLTIRNATAETAVLLVACRRVEHAVSLAREALHTGCPVKLAPIEYDGVEAVARIGPSELKKLMRFTDAETWRRLWEEQVSEAFAELPETEEQ